jgi:MYXO-CTERM domain-containing protein
MLTELLAWRLMKEELPESSGVALARLSLQLTDTSESRYQGLYLLIEDLDRTAVRARYTASEGTLFKTTDINCEDEVVYDDELPNSATAGFEQWLALDPDDFVDSWFERTNQALQLDGLLRQEALRELFVNGADTALGALNNYYALDLDGARRIYLPWDLDDMFRPQPQIRDIDTALESSCVGGGGPFGGGNACSPIPLGVNIRDTPEIRERYLDILCRLTNGVAEESRLLQRYNELDAQVRPIVATEVAALWEPEGLDPLDETEPGTYAAEALRMQSWIVGRVQAVRALIESEGVPCPVGCEDAALAPCDYFGCPSQRVCESGRWGACQVPAAHVPGGLDVDCDGVLEASPPVVAAPEPTGEEPADVDVSPQGTPEPTGLPVSAPSGGADAGSSEASRELGSSGCGCRFPGGTAAPSGGVLGLVAVCLGGLRRRRRRGAGGTRALGRETPGQPIRAQRSALR